MTQRFLKEEDTPYKLDVRFSEELAEEIENIDFYNQFEPEAIARWHYYLEGMISWISNPVIAWDNMNVYRHDSDGTTYVISMGYNITFVIKENENTHETYLYISDTNLNEEEFGLKNPSLYEDKKQAVKQKRVYILNESQLRRIIREAIRKIIA